MSRRLRKSGYLIVAMTKAPAGGTLVLVCMETGGEINSHTEYTLEDLLRAREAKLLLYCRYCGKSHLFKFADARLKPIRH